MSEEWDGLDNAAKENLGDYGFERFLRYKGELRKDGHTWKDDAHDILTGYIWDESKKFDEDA